MQLSSPQVNPSVTRRQPVRFFLVHPDKLLVLTVLTGGLYALYWFYKNWKGVNQSGYSTMPVLFGVVFHPISAFGLFRLMRKASQKAGYPKQPLLWLDGAIWLSLHLVVVGLIINIPQFLTSIVGYQGMILSLMGLVIMGAWLLQDIQQGVQHYINVTDPERVNNDTIEGIHIGLTTVFLMVYVSLFFFYPKDIPFYPQFEMDIQPILEMSSIATAPLFRIE